MLVRVRLFFMGVGPVLERLRHELVVPIRLRRAGIGLLGNLMRLRRGTMRLLSVRFSGNLSRVMGGGCGLLGVISRFLGLRQVLHLVLRVLRGLARLRLGFVGDRRVGLGFLNFNRGVLAQYRFAVNDVEIKFVGLAANAGVPGVTVLN